MLSPLGAEHLETIHANGEQLLNLVNDILDFSDAGDPGPWPLSGDVWVAEGDRTRRMLMKAHLHPPRSPSTKTSSLLRFPDHATERYIEDYQDLVVKTARPFSEFPHWLQ